MIVLIIALIVFGPKRIPELGNSLGRGIREFRNTVTSNHDDDSDEDETVRTLDSSDTSEELKAARARVSELQSERDPESELAAAKARIRELEQLQKAEKVETVDGEVISEKRG